MTNYYRALLLTFLFFGQRLFTSFIIFFFNFTICFLWRELWLRFFLFGRYLTSIALLKHFFIALQIGNILRNKITSYPQLIAKLVCWSITSLCLLLFRCVPQRSSLLIICWQTMQLNCSRALYLRYKVIGFDDLLFSLTLVALPGERVVDFLLLSATIALCLLHESSVVLLLRFGRHNLQTGLSVWCALFRFRGRGQWYRGWDSCSSTVGCYGYTSVSLTTPWQLLVDSLWGRSFENTGARIPNL